MYPEDFDDLIIETRADFDSLDQNTKIAVCVHQLEAQVNNGGFDQFFFNSSGAYTLDTISALETIGAHSTAKLLCDAVAIAYPEGFPGDSSLHQANLIDEESVSDALDLLDASFYAYKDDLAMLVNRHLGNDT